MEPEEHHRILHMPPSMTTVASSSSSHNELHRTFNESEGRRMVGTGLDGHEGFNMASDHQSTADTLQSATVSSGTLVQHSDLHRDINEKPDADIAILEAKEQQMSDVGYEKRQEIKPISQPEKGLEGAANSAFASGIGQNHNEYVTGIRLYLILATITLVYYLVMLDNTILTTAIPYITDDFDSLLDVGWYGSAYLLCSSALQPFGGKVYSKFNSKWCFIVYLILFEVGSVVCGRASSSTMLIAGRAIAGVGGSGLLNGGLIILNSCVPPHRQPGLVGIMMGLGNLGIAFGPLIGGAFTEYVTWRWCFYINLPIGGVVALVIVLIRIPDHIVKPSRRSVFKHVIIDFDLPGFGLFVPAAVMIFLALQYGGNQYRWDSSQIIGLFCGAGATFIVWLIWNFYQGDNAMVPPSMMRRRICWAGCVAGLFMNGSMFVTAYYLPIYFQAVLGVSPFMSGVDVLPNILTQMVFAFVAGVLIQRIGYYTPFILIGAALNTIACALLSLLTPDATTGQWVGFQILMGTGRGLSVAVPFLAIQNSLPKEIIPAGMSTLVFLQNYSAAVMIVLSQTILTNSLTSLVPRDAPGVDPRLVISAGTTATAVVQAVGADHLPGVQLAYSEALRRIWYFAAGIGAAAFLTGWCLGWQNIRKRAEGPDSNESGETSGR